VCAKTFEHFDFIKFQLRYMKKANVNFEIPLFCGGARIILDSESIPTRFAAAHIIGDDIFIYTDSNLSSFLGVGILVAFFAKNHIFYTLFYRKIIVFRRFFNVNSL
jgi:hypothetical protein